MFRCSRVRAFFFAVLLLVIIGENPRLFAWEKIGVFEGNITAIHKTNSYYFVATAGAGVYRSVDRQTWVQINDGLEDLEIVALTSDPSVSSTIYCCGLNIIYKSLNSGTSWSVHYQPISSAGVKPRITSLLVHSCSVPPETTWLYVGTLGWGLWRVNGSGTWQQSINIPPRVLSLASYGNKIFAGAQYFTAGAQSSFGGIWWFTCNNPSAAQVIYSTMGSSWPAIASHGTNNLILAGSSDRGIYVSPDAGVNFEPLCNNYLPPTGAFQAVDFYFDGSVFKGLAGGQDGLWCLPQVSSCSNGYVKLPFVGNVSAVGVFDLYTGLMGTSGKGLFRVGNGTDTGICSDLQHVGVNQIQHQQVNRIAVSKHFSTDPATNDDTIFIASRSEGLYKSVGFGTRIVGSGFAREFTRSFCNPQSFEPSDILSIALCPDYDDHGTAYPFPYPPYPTQKIVYLGSNGSGVFKSLDGGASWSNATGGTMPFNAIVTDIEFTPNGFAIFAAVWNDGLYKTSVMGPGNYWEKIDCSLNIHDIAISPDFSNDSTVWLATEEGIIRVFCPPPDYIWECAPTGICVPDQPPSCLPVHDLAVTWLAGSTYVYFSSHENGVSRGIYNTSGQWSEIQLAQTGTIGPNSRIVELEVSPGWYTNPLDYVVVYAIKSGISGDQVYYTNDHPLSGFSGWTEVTPNITGIPARFLSLAFHPEFDPTDAQVENNEIFLGHAYRGLLHYTHLVDTSWDQADGYYAYPHQVNSTSVDPEDSSIVLFATDKMGMFISYDGGDSACPFGNRLDYEGTDYHRYTVAGVNSIAITDSYSRFFEANFFYDFSSSGWTVEDNDGDGYSWFRQLGANGYCGPACNPSEFDYYDFYAQVDSNCAFACPSPHTSADILISPEVLCDTALSMVLEFDHYFERKNTETAQLTVRTKVSSSSEWSDWQTVKTWTASTLNPQHEMIELTSKIQGKYEFQFAFNYLGGLNAYYWFIGEPWCWGHSTFPARRQVIVGTDDHGIYTTSYVSAADSRSSMWSQAPSPLEGTPPEFLLKDTTVSKISWQGPGEDMWASVVGFSYSGTTDPPPKPKAAYSSKDLGQTWFPLASGISGDTLLSDIAFGRPYGEERFRHSTDQNRQGYPSVRDQTVTMWGCSGGRKTAPYKVGTFTDQRATTATAGAYQYDSTNWVLKNGTVPDYLLSEELYYKAVLETSGGDVLVGGWIDDGINNQASGVWLSHNLGDSWFQVNAGLETLNSRQVTSLFETDTGEILLGINHATEGGVFMSDNGGYAWVRVDDFTGSEKGVNGLSESTKSPLTYFASMVHDGSQRALSFTPQGAPVPEFLMNGDPLTLADVRYPSDPDYFRWASTTVGASVTFTSKSAGIDEFTSYAWDFDGDGFDDGTGASIVFTFLSGGIKTVRLQLNGENDLIRFHKIFVLDDTPPPIPDGATLGQAMSASKTSNDGSTILVTWDDVCTPFAANILYGPISFVSSYEISGSDCNIAPVYSWAIDSTNIWFVIVSDNGDHFDPVEGSWGKSSAGVERNLEGASMQCDCLTKNSGGSCL